MRITTSQFFQMRSNQSGNGRQKKVLTKLRNWVTGIFMKDAKKQDICGDVSYFDTKHFHNDLQNPEDYYLRVSSTEKNIFVRKDEIDDN